MFILFIIFIIIAYVLGSLNSAIIVSKLMGLPDPRTQGSQNPGATNVLRLGGTTPAIIVLVADALKGFIPVLLARWLGLYDVSLGLVAVAALVGHIYPVFFNFQGGKGVATGFGALLAYAPLVAILSLIIWIVVAAILRYASLASLCGAVGAVILSVFFAPNFKFFIPIAIMALLLIWRHQENIQRLRDKTESKIDFSKFKK